MCNLRGDFRQTVFCHERENHHLQRHQVWWYLQNNSVLDTRICVLQCRVYHPLSSITRLNDMRDHPATCFAYCTIFETYLGRENFETLSFEVSCLAVGFSQFLRVHGLQSIYYRSRL